MSAAQSKSDFGPGIRLNRGDVVAVNGRCPVTGKAVRHGRAVCHYDRLHARGGLDDGERDAARIYGELLERVVGGGSAPEVKVDSSAKPGQGHPTELQVHAATRLRKVRDILGPSATGLVDLFAGDNLPASEIAARHGLTDQQCIGRIRAALTRLAEHWRL